MSAPSGVYLKDRGKCPKCGYLLDAHTYVGGDVEAKPQEGDLSVCFSCTALLVYTKNGLRLMTDQEYAELTTQERAYLDFAKAKIGKFHERNKKP